MLEKFKNIVDMFDKQNYLFTFNASIHRSSPSKLDFSPVKSPELNFASLSGDKLTVAQV